MEKIYVDLEELEKKFCEYNIPYTNIFDELKHQAANEVAAEMTISELEEIIRNKKDVFAMQIWQKKDVCAAINTTGIKPDDTLVAAVIGRIQKQLNDCSDNWSKIYAAVKESVKEK